MLEITISQKFQFWISLESQNSLLLYEDAYSFWLVPLNNGLLKAGHSEFQKELIFRLHWEDRLSNENLVHSGFLFSLIHFPVTQSHSCLFALSLWLAYFNLWFCLKKVLLIENIYSFYTTLEVCSVLQNLSCKKFFASSSS